MTPPTRSRVRRTALGLLLTALGVLLMACGPGQSTELTCGTDARPPIAAPSTSCAPLPQNVSWTQLDDVTNGHRWYWADRDDVADPDERPQVGQPLDGDWWDPTDRYEAPRTSTSTPKPTTPARSTTSARSTR